MGEPNIGDRANSERGNNIRLLENKGLGARRGISEATLPFRLRTDQPETYQELYRPLEIERPWSKEYQERYKLLPPFFDLSWEARWARQQAAFDATSEWSSDTGDWGVIREAVADATLGLVKVSTPTKFNPQFDENADYVEQFFITLEHVYEHPPYLRAGITGGARGLARLATIFFPEGRAIMGIYKIGSYGARGHHVIAKAAFPKSIHDRMFSISARMIADLGLKWSHDKMTVMQKFLYRQLIERGGAHTMKDHLHIAYAALRHGGATHKQARWLVGAALRNLRQLGVRHPTHLPKFGRMAIPKSK